MYSCLCNQVEVNKTDQYFEWHWGKSSKICKLDICVQECADISNKLQLLNILVLNCAFTAQKFTQINKISQTFSVCMRQIQGLFLPRLVFWKFYDWLTTGQDTIIMENINCLKSLLQIFAFKVSSKGQKMQILHIFPTFNSNEIFDTLHLVPWKEFLFCY